MEVVPVVPVSSVLFGHPPRLLRQRLHWPRDAAGPCEAESGRARKAKREIPEFFGPEEVKAGDGGEQEQGRCRLFAFIFVDIEVGRHTSSPSRCENSLILAYPL